MTSRDGDRAMLQLIRAGGERASWYWIGTRTGEVLPRDSDWQAMLDDLRDRGLVTRTATGAGMDRWRLTATGAAWLDGALPAGPLGEDALIELIAALRDGIIDAMPLLTEMMARPDRLWGALRQVSATEPDVAVNAALGATCLPVDRRMAYLGELLADPRPPVRAGVFAAFVQPAAELEGDAHLPVPAEELDRLLRPGLVDVALPVRIAAAKLAFAAARGAAVSGELIVNAYAPEVELRRWVLLAMGSADDPLTLALLDEAAASDHAVYAACARRALAARLD